jgi:tartrate dehydrogenase/decarboxylase/D-malate dehydrogenase
VSSQRIAVIPGDGIGAEVIAQGIRVLDAAAARFGFVLDYERFDWGCRTYVDTGRMMPEDGIDRLADSDAIYLGAVGWPGVPDHVSLWGLLLPIRQRFDQYVNLRPCRLLPGVESPLAGRRPGDIDFVVVRENTEGEYTRIGGRVREGTPDELVLQQAVYTRKGVDRVLRYAFELARERGRGSRARRTQPSRSSERSTDPATRGARTPRVTSATKSNGLWHSMPFWDECFEEIAAEYPDVESERSHVDALAARFVGRPEHFDVVVAGNLFGDILSDLGPAVTGSIGIAPSANINPEREAPSMFEPVHGSAPDIAGRGIANPIGAIWSGAMMLEHLGHGEAARAIEDAIAHVLAEGGPRTPDLGGEATTADVGIAIAESF